jgi:hypothetical protein
VSSFRPIARVEDPRGNQWEVYEYRLRIPRRRVHDPEPLSDLPVFGFGTGQAAAGVLLGVADAVAWLLGLLASLVVRIIWDLPLNALRLRRTTEWTVEAVSWYPAKTSYRWKVMGKPEHKDIDELTEQLARGRAPRLRGGVLLDEFAP